MAAVEAMVRVVDATSPAAMILVRGQHERVRPRETPAASIVNVNKVFDVDVPCAVHLAQLLQLKLCVVRY